MEKTLSAEDIKEILATQALGHLACCLDDKPYVIPMAFTYKNNILYGQTTEGKKTDILRQKPNCCFQVGDTKGTHWRSVLCEGTFEELDFSSGKDPEAIEAVEQLSKRLATIQDVVGIHVLEKATLFRIVITDIHGRGGKLGQ